MSMPIVPWDAPEGKTFSGVLWWTRIEGYVVEVRLGPQGRGFGWLLVFDFPHRDWSSGPIEVMTSGHAVAGIREGLEKTWRKAAQDAIADHERL